MSPSNTQAKCSYQSLSKHVVYHGAVNGTVDHNASGWHSGQIAAPVIGDRTPGSIWTEQLEVISLQTLCPCFPFS